MVVKTKKLAKMSEKKDELVVGEKIAGGVTKGLQ